MKKSKVCVLALEISENGRGIHKYQLSMIENVYNNLNNDNYEVDIYISKEAVPLIKGANTMNIIPITMKNNVLYKYFLISYLAIRKKYNIIHSMSDILPLYRNSRMILNCFEPVKMRINEFRQKHNMISYILKRLMEHISLSNADVVITLSEYIKAEINSQKRNLRIVVQRPVASCNELYQKNCKNYNLIIVGGDRDVNEDVIEYLQNKNISLVCLGRLPLPKYSSITQHYNLPDKSVISLIANSNIYIHLSRIEGFGYTILEALTLGVKVIAPRTTAITEMLPQEYLYTNIAEFKTLYEKINLMSENEYFKSIHLGEYNWEESIKLMNSVFEGI